MMAKNKNQKNEPAVSKPRVGGKVAGIVFISFILMLFLALLSFHPQDVTYLDQGIEGGPVWRNWIGYFGAASARVLLLLFGFAIYPAVVICMLSLFRRFLCYKAIRTSGWEYWTSFLLILIGASMVFGIFPESFPAASSYLNISGTAGGALGQYLCDPSSGILSTVLSHTGSALTGATLIAVALTVLWIYDWHDSFIAWERKLRASREESDEATATDEDASFARAAAAGRSGNNKKERSQADTKQRDSEQILRNRERERETGKFENRARKKNTATSRQSEALKGYEKTVKGETAASLKKSDRRPSSKKSSGRGQGSSYQLPPLDLLNEADDNIETTVNPREVEKKKEILQATLDSFKIDAKVGQTTTGPRVTLFEVEPAPGVKVERISNLGNNIAMELQAQSLRILTPIPGRKSVGIEVPNNQAAVVSLCGLMNSPAWRNKKVAIPLLLGRNISGKPVLLDLAKAPHLLIAGATGSGKSVCINALIMSLLYRFTPEELRLILIDPKVVEFSGYNSLPHLAVPVITESQKVVMALRWVIKEMEKRYNILAAVGARNIAAFNARSSKKSGEQDKHGNVIPERMPYLVVIIDELADIMMTSRSEIENSLARIAQLSRAVGIHTIIATQRPSVNVITGIIKANYPTRIAFQVTSQVDSRTILDGKGAEKLLGSGDMLFKPPGASQLERNQSPLVEDDEIDAVVEHVSCQQEQQFIEDVFKSTGDSEGDGEFGGDLSDEDEKLVERAIEIILQDRRASTSYVQRCLRIGYNRAALIMEILEQRGVVGPQVGSASREILISKEDDDQDSEELVEDDGEEDFSADYDDEESTEEVDYEK